MKKAALLLIFTVLTVLVSNAQFFVGGAFGFHAESGSHKINGDKEDKESDVSFSFSPQVGYMISADFAVGVYAGFGIGRENNNADPEIISKSTSFNLAPFARYYALRFNKFALYGEAQVYFGVRSSKTKYDGDMNDGTTTTQIGLSIYPGMAYDLSDRFQLMAYINAFRFGINHQIINNKDLDIVDSTNEIGLDVSLNNIFTTGYITVGCIFKF